MEHLDVIGILMAGAGILLAGMAAMFTAIWPPYCDCIDEE